MAYRVCMLAVGKLPVPAVQGGACEALAQALLDQNERDPRIEFTVLSVDHPEARKQAAGYKHAKFVWFKPQVLWNKFWWRIRAAGIQLAHRELPFPYQRVQAAKWLRSHADEFDFILTECDLDAIQYAGIAPEKVLYHLHWVGRPTAQNDASFGQLIPVSEFVGRGWADATGRSMDTVHVLPNAVPDHCFAVQPPETRSEMRRKLGIAADAFVVLYVGRIVAYKGVRELMQVVDRLPDDNTVLVLAGSTNFGLGTCDEYERQAHALAQQSKKQMLFTGFVPNDQLGPYYAMADVVAMPSLCQEAAGMVAIEAMAAGRPVAASISGGLPEYVTPECGILVPQGDGLEEGLREALIKLRADPALRDAMGKAGQARAQQFRQRAYFQRFLDIVQNLHA